MPTYYIRYPEDPEKKTLISNLIGTLEKLNGIVVFDAIGVVLQVGDAESELIRSLARDVIPERPAFADLIKEVLDECGVLLPDGPLPEISETVVAGMAQAIERGFAAPLDYGSIPEGEAGKLPADELAVFGMAPKPSVSSGYQRVTKKERKCPQCGRSYLPQSNRQTYCSKTCRINASALASSKNGSHNAPPPRKRDGSGLKQGKLVGP